MNALDYLLKANLYGLLFAGCYHLLLRRHTFLHLNRLYLLLAVAFTLTLPLISLTPEETEALPEVVPVGVLTLPTVPVTTVDRVSSPVATNWNVLAGVAYGLIALLLLGWVGVRMGRIWHLIRRSERRQYGDFTLVIPAATSIATFSFFRYIVLNPTDAGSPLVLQHEQVHVRQWHSADVLALAVVRALAWGCPALWLLDRALRQVHEFLADHATVHRQNTQPHQYAQFLVDYAFGVRPDMLTNGFVNPTLLKQRIQMLHRRATTRWALGKYALLLPLSLALLAMTSVSRELEALVHQATEKPITIKGWVTSTADGKPLPGVEVRVQGKQRGTSTNADGGYVIQAAPAESLTFSFQGFKSYTVPLRNHSHKATLSLNVSLQSIRPATGVKTGQKVAKPDLHTLPAASTQTEISAALDPAPKERKTTQSTPADTLPTKRTLWHPTGDIPGFSPTNGQSRDRYTLPLPDSLRLLAHPAATVRISSLSQAEPLYVIDSVIVEKITPDILNPNQIESITVLKNKSATATYGEKGKNGVILIKTRKP